MGELVSAIMLREIFDYDEVAGEVRWKAKVNRFIKVGKVAGSKTKNGVSVGVGGRLIPAGRVIWAWHYGAWPKGSIRHKDRNKMNNRIENLREVEAKSSGRPRKEKIVYPTPREVPVELVREFFFFNSKNIPCWKKKAGPKSRIGAPAGWGYGGNYFIGFQGHTFDARWIGYALANGEWPEN